MLFIVSNHSHFDFCREKSGGRRSYLVLVARKSPFHSLALFGYLFKHQCCVCGGGGRGGWVGGWVGGGGSLTPYCFPYLYVIK